MTNQECEIVDVSGIVNAARELREAVCYRMVDVIRFRRALLEPRQGGNNALFTADQVCSIVSALNRSIVLPSPAEHPAQPEANC
jgi:hypothetical protein